MQAALSATPGVLTVELEPSAILSTRPPEPLSRDNAELLAGPIADDLRRIMGDEIVDAGLILPAALYDLTEILRPGLPMVEALLDIYRGSLRGGPFVPQLLALGSSGGRFPESAVAPARRPGSGPLLVIPFALVAPGPQLDPLRSQLEQVLLEKGRAGLPTDRALRQLLGVEPVHLSYATFHDLSALLKVQLEHAEFSGLWQLLEGALYRPDQIERVSLETHNQFIGMGGAVWTPWLTYDDWAARQQVSSRDAEAGYVQWTQIQRQYMAGLESHGIEVRVVEPKPGLDADDPEVALGVAQAHCLDGETSWFRETITQKTDAGPVSVVSLTEQSSPLLGPIAYTALLQAEDGTLIELSHDYPIQESGIRDLQADWEASAQALGATYHLERPGVVTASGEPAKLQPWLEFGGRA